MENWFQDETFWQELYPFLFPARRFAAAAEEVEQVRKLVGIGKGNVLDLACGPGRHAVEFAQVGFSVTGVDMSPYLLGLARDKAKELGVQVEWVQDDMRSFSRENEYDLVVNLFSSFGYFATPDDDAQVLGNVYKSLKSGGIFIMDLIGKELLARVFQPTLSSELEDGRVLVQRQKIINDWEQVENQWILLQGENNRKFSFKMRLYSARELRTLLLQSGFQNVTVFGGLEGSAYDSTAGRLVLVAGKI